MFNSTKALCASTFTGLLLSLTLFSCEKKVKPDPAGDYVLTDKRFAGKWEVTAQHFYLYKDSSLISTWEFIKYVGEVKDGTPVGSGPWLEQVHTTYFNANADHSFTHTDINGTPNGAMLEDVLPYEGGTWAVKDPKTIELTTHSSYDHSLQQVNWEVVTYDYYGLIIRQRGRTNMGDSTAFYETATELELAPVQ